MTSVLLDARPLRSPLSGVGQYVRNLAVALSVEAEVQLGLLEFDFLGRQSIFRHQLGIDRHRISTQPHRLLHRKAFNGLAAYTRVPVGNLLRLDRFDIVHGTYFERLPVIAGRRPPASRCIEVSTVHDVGFLRHPELFDRRNLAASRRALKQQVERSSVIFTPSRFTADELVSLTGVDERRVVVTPLASTSRRHRSPSTPAPHGDGARRFALYVGNIDPRKNVPELIDAWLAEGLGRDWDLVLAGGPLPGSAALVERLEGLRGRGVRYLGYVTDEQRDALFRAAACFVYPSQYEGFGLPVLEAMAAGAPVLISDAPALVEVAGNAAEVVPLSQLHHLGGAMRRMLEDENLRSGLAARGVARASLFSWGATARATRRGYDLALRDR